MSYRLWVNDERTVLVRQWQGGTVEFATRETPAHTWGPPTILLEETKQASADRGEVASPDGEKVS